MTAPAVLLEEDEAVVLLQTRTLVTRRATAGRGYIVPKNKMSCREADKTYVEKVLHQLQNSDIAESYRGSHVIEGSCQDIGFDFKHPLDPCFTQLDLWLRSGARYADDYRHFLAEDQKASNAFRFNCGNLCKLRAIQSCPQSDPIGWEGVPVLRMALHTIGQPDTGKARRGQTYFIPSNKMSCQESNNKTYISLVLQQLKLSDVGENYKDSTVLDGSCAQMDFSHHLHHDTCFPGLQTWLRSQPHFVNDYRSYLLDDYKASQAYKASCDAHCMSTTQQSCPQSAPAVWNGAPALRLSVASLLLYSAVLTGLVCNQ